MRLFKWSKANACFVPEIDDEHRAICAEADKLYQALTAVPSGFDVPDVLAIFHRLVVTAETHLKHEERLMRSTRYQAFDWHKKQHDTIRKRLRQFVPFVENGDRRGALATIEYLSKWLSDHLGVADRMLGAHLRSKGYLRAA